MTHVFYLDFYPDAHLVTAANPELQRWNGWAIPNPTPREMMRFLDELRPLMGEDEWWDTLSAFMAAYGNDRHDDVHHGMDESIQGYMGFTWQEREMFNPTARRLNLIEAQGHWERKGHRLVGYYVPTDNDTVESEVLELVLLCCPKPKPEREGTITVDAETWARMHAVHEAAPSALIEYLRKHGSI